MRSFTDSSAGGDGALRYGVLPLKVLPLKAGYCR
jgi:hypothetical protein